MSRGNVFPEILNTFWPIGPNWAELSKIFTLGRLFVEEPCDEALIPVDCRLCSEVIEFDLLEPPAPSSSFISDTLTSEKVCQITAIIILSKVLKVLKLSDDISDTLTSKIGT